MWATMFSLFLFKKFLCIFLSGVTIKMMDDYLDMEIDELVKQKNIFTIIGTGGVPYMLLIFALACALELATAVTLFIASFSLGMMGQIDAKMPSGLYGYQESILVLLISLYFFGLRETFSSIFIMASIQLWDDLLDFDLDIVSKKNWAFIMGRGECLLLIGIFVLSALYIDGIKTVLSLLMMYIIVYIINVWLTYFETAYTENEVEWNDL